MMQLIVGLEIHVELKTNSKMFCSCGTRFGAPVGSQCCPICMGLPGTLPLLNEAAVRLGVIAGAALHSEIQPYSLFDRKQYFYPDMPKGYQITQHFHPLCLGGWLTLPESGKRIELEEMHLEEDSGKLVHDTDSSYINLNRCGIPLLEIVTKPVIENGDQAYEFLSLLRDTLVCSGVTTGKMQEGALRVDVNVSLRNINSNSGMYRTEMKNLSSFRAVRMAIDHEGERQKKLLDDGIKPLSETRRWDEKGGFSEPLREKGDAIDYRYLPEPDLLPLFISEDFIHQCKKSLPILPEETLLRLMTIPNMKSNQASILANNCQLLACFDAAYARIRDAKRILNWLLGDYRAIAKKNNLSPENPPFDPNDFAELMNFSIERDLNYQEIRNKMMLLCRL